MYLREDSFFLSEELKSYLKGKDKNIKILDMGSGSGIQAQTCLQAGFKDILAADIGKEEISSLKRKCFKAIKSNLFQNIKGKFDLIIFNPPYLPESKYDKQKDTTGGKKGDETIIRFLKQARSHLTRKGKILLLLSSLTPRARINKIIKQYYKKKILAKKRIFFEKLEVWWISKRNHRTII